MNHEITIQDMENLCEKTFQIKKECDALNEELEEKKRDLTNCQKRLEAYLSHHDKKKWESRFGVVELREKLSVKIPRTEEDKKQLFSWLRERGIFWQFVGVNSQSLNALYKSEFEASQEKGTECKIPGIGDPEVYTQIVLRGAK